MYLFRRSFVPTEFYKANQNKLTFLLLGEDSMPHDIRNLITLYHGFLEQSGRSQPIVLYEKKSDLISYLLHKDRKRLIIHAAAAA